MACTKPIPTMPVSGVEFIKITVNAMYTQYMFMYINAFYLHRLDMSVSEGTYTTPPPTGNACMIYIYSIKRKKREIVKTEDDAIPLPDPFPLPKYFSRDVEKALENNILPTRERRAFLSDIASSVLQFKRYPTRDDYINVCSAVCPTYPFLKATSGKPYVCMD